MMLKDLIERCKNDENTVIEKSIFNNTATMVIWSDGTKIIVRCGLKESRK